MSRHALTGRVLGGRYELGPLLGTGGMASVFRGTDRVLERTVAVKVLHPRIAGDPSYIERFRREATLAATLSHPGVVSVFDTGQDGGVRFIVMEHVEGRTLAEEIAEHGALEPDRAAAIAGEVCDALAAAHARGLVHRDVKPGNIMLDPSGRAKVMDFGIARADSADTLTQTATVMGTAAYLSPEQARGERADARSDLYALGCVLYAMLTGEPPFSGHSAVAVATRHVSEDPRPPSSRSVGVPAPLEDVVMRALAKDPADRFPDALAFRDAIRGAAGEAPTHPLTEPSLPPTQPLPVPPPALRPEWRRALGAATLVGGLLAMVVLGYLLTSGGDRPGRAAEPRGERPTETAEPTPEPTTPEPTTPPPSPVPPSAEEAYDSLVGVLTAAVGSGEMEEKAAEKVAGHAEHALEKSREADPDKARDEVEKSAHELEKAADKGEVTPEAAARIVDALEQLLAAISGA